MSFSFQRILCSAIPATAVIGAFAYWTQRDREGQEGGSLITKKIQELSSTIKEVATAFQQASQIQVQDSYTAKKHVWTVFKLSSEAATADNEYKLRSGAAYPSEEQHAPPCMTPLVFKYNHQRLLKIYADQKIEKDSYLTFAGPLSQLHSLQAREAILEGNYVVCPSEIVFRKSSKSKRRPVEILLTGTKDCQKCQHMKYGEISQIFEEFALYSPSVEKFDREELYLDHEGNKRRGVIVVSTTSKEAYQNLVTFWLNKQLKESRQEKTKNQE